MNKNPENEKDLSAFMSCLNLVKEEHQVFLLKNIRFL